MKRFLPLILILLLGFSTQQTLAQSDWRYCWDFTLNNGSFAPEYVGPGSVPHAQYFPGVGWGVNQSEYWPDSFNITSPNWTTPVIQFDDVIVTTDIALSGTSYNKYWLSPGYGLDQYQNATPGETEHHFGSTAAMGFTSGFGVLWKVGIEAISSPQVYWSGHITFLEVDGSGTEPSFSGGYECDSPPPPPGDYTRPYRSTDEFEVYDDNRFELPSWTDLVVTSPLAQVYAISNAPGTPVMAAENGTVTLRTLTSGDCSFNLWGIIGNRCTFVIGTDVNVVGAFFDLFSFEVTNETWLVTLNGEDGKTFNYVVADADHYLSQDMQVHAGCVIGESIAFQGALPTDATTLIQGLVAFLSGVNPGDFKLGNDHGHGISLIRFYDNNPDLLSGLVDPVVDQLSVYNEEAQPCNLAPGLQDCLNSNPTFRRDGEGWTAVGNVTYGAGGGVILSAGASLGQQLNLASEVEYTLIVHASWVIDADFPNRVDRNLHLRLGQDTEDFIIPSDGNIGEYAIPMDIHDPDVGDFFWTMLIQNSGNYDLFVQDACVTSSTTHTTPQACYFANSEFDDYSSGWTSSSPSPIVLAFEGFVQLPDGGWISQNVALDPGEYTLTVRAHDYGDHANQSTGTAELFYTWPSDTASPVSIGELDIAYTHSGHPGYPNDFQILSTIISVEEATDGDFQISAAVSGANVDGIEIDSACLGTEGESVGPPAPECSSAARPQDDSLGEWISWQWHNLNQFFQCDLMVLLNKMYMVGLDTYHTLGFWVKWQLAFVYNLNRWVDASLFPWLEGHFHNMAIGQVTTIIDGGDGCHDIFCAIGGLIGGLQPIIDALANAINALVAILLAGASLFFTLLGGLVTFILALIVHMFSILDSILHLFTSLIGAYNSATPTAIPGLPVCATDPDSSLLCRAVWVMDNTIFKDRWGILFVLVLAILSIHLILWAIGELRNTIVHMGGSS